MERRRLRQWLLGSGLLAGLCLGQLTLNADDGLLPAPITQSAQPLPTALPAPELLAPAPVTAAPLSPVLGLPADEKPPAPPPDALPPSTQPPAAAEGSCASADQVCGRADRAKDVPPVAVFPRPGWFPNPPTGPGYYTLCDQLVGEWRQKPPKYPYSRTSIQPQSFFDIGWRYLDDPKNTEHDFFDCLKRVRCGPDDLFMLTIGGEFRARF